MSTRQKASMSLKETQKQQKLAQNKWNHRQKLSASTRYRVKLIQIN